MIMTVDGKCRVNAPPSLVHVVACAAGAVAVPIQICAAQHDDQNTTRLTLQLRRGSDHSGQRR
jgi:hypothetical protein